MELSLKLSVPYMYRLGVFFCIFVVILGFILQFVNAAGDVEPLYYKEYLGRGTEKEYLPVTVLYDPYGDNSYQQIETESTIEVTFQMKGAAAGVIASGSTTTSVTYETTYSSSRSTDPADMGPGVGDSIIGKIYYLTWDVWVVYSPGEGWYYEYKLVSASPVGTFVLSRNDLATEDTYVEDKTGEIGSYRHLWDISANRPVSHSVTYSWSGTISVGYSFEVNILGIKSGITYLMSFSGTQSYTITAHYEDSSKKLTFWENADNADPTLDNIYSYVFWYSPA